MLPSIESTFQKAGLPVPAVPQAWEASVHEQGDWLFGSEPPPAGPLIQFGSYFLAAMSNELPDGVWFGHDGYGTNNWALHYYLKVPGLVVLVQIPWGGAYVDREASEAAIRQQFAHLASLLQEFQLAQNESCVLPGRLVVLIDRELGGRWGWESSAGEPDWQFSDCPMEEAAEDLTARCAREAWQ
ncbi:MAG: hypothetical protein HUJ26_05420 [Planctomycetaceae bacterium]|nr:hypothetical protein [Planctomycetaceae bacterium]